MPCLQHCMLKPSHVVVNKHLGEENFLAGSQHLDVKSLLKEPLKNYYIECTKHLCINLKPSSGLPYWSGE